MAGSTAGLVEHIFEQQSSKCLQLQCRDNGVRTWIHVAAVAGAVAANGNIPNSARCSQLSAGISACEKGGEWQMALFLLSQMSAAQVVPDQISF